MKMGVLEVRLGSVGNIEIGHYSPNSSPVGKIL